MTSRYIPRGVKRLPSLILSFRQTDRHCSTLYYRYKNFLSWFSVVLKQINLELKIELDKWTSAVWSFTSSLTITFAALTSILFAILTAYFIYTCIFNLKFFPFMNILAVIITLGMVRDSYSNNQFYTKSRNLQSKMEVYFVFI